MSPTRQVAVVGAGPAGLMAAEVLARGGAPVTVFDRMPSPGRKFLLTGRGGLNLTHTEAFERFAARYCAAAASLRPALEAFPPAALREWCEELGEPIFVGSSGRVFPQSFKASPLLRAWLKRLEALGVRFQGRHRWTGWDGSGELQFETPSGSIWVDPAATVLALGGATWPQLGSDGRWTGPVREAGIMVSALRPSNCGMIVPWSETFGARFAGVPLKGITLSFEGHTSRGEAVVTRTGLEGGGIYALSGPVRDTIEARGEAILSIDLKPGLDAGELIRRIASRNRKQSISTFLAKTLNLSRVAIGLLQESAHGTSEPLSGVRPEPLAERIKAVPVQLIGTAPIDRAISTAGGIPLAELDPTFMLRRRPGTFAAGEMLDWEAPTGGYLLQASFATGAAAGAGALAWLEQHRAEPWPA